MSGDYGGGSSRLSCMKDELPSSLAPGRTLAHRWSPSEQTGKHAHPSSS